MIFRLRGYVTPNPIPSLGGSRVRYKPVVPLRVIGPGGQYNPPVLVDSGADDVVFPIGVAPQLGIDLAHAAYLDAQGVGGGSARVFYAPAILLLTDGVDTYRWRAVVGFRRV